ncbi:transposase [Acetobacter sp.]
MPTGRRGSRRSYSNVAIQTRLTQKVFFGMALGQTPGVVENLLYLA